MSPVSLVRFAGLGLKLDAAKDIEDIIKALKNQDGIQTLNISGNTLGIPAAEVLGRALGSVSTLEHCIFSDLFTGRMKTEIAPALRHISTGIMSSGAHLVELDLSDNAFGPNGVVGVVDLLSSPACFTLQILRMNNQGLGHEGCRHLAEALRQGREASNGRGLLLKVFTAGRNRLENVGIAMLADVLRELKSLEEVSFYQNGIGIHGIEGVKSLVSILKGNPNLRLINLSDNNITPAGGKAIAKSLKSLVKVEELYLSDCILRSEGTRYLAEVLADSEVAPALRVLDLTGNEIARSAAISLILSLGTKTQLESLDLNSNEFGQSGIQSIRDTLDSVGLLHVLCKRGQAECEDEDDLLQIAFGDDQGSASEEDELQEESGSEPAHDSGRFDNELSDSEQDENGEGAGFVEEKQSSNKTTNGFSFRQFGALLNLETCSPSATDRSPNSGLSSKGLFSNLGTDSTDAATVRSKLWSQPAAAPTVPTGARQTSGGLFAPPILSVPTPPSISSATIKALESQLLVCLSDVSNEEAISHLADLLKDAKGFEAIFTHSKFSSFTDPVSPEDTVRLSIRLSHHIPRPLPKETTPLVQFAAGLLASVLSSPGPSSENDNTVTVCPRSSQAVNCLLVYLGAIKAEPDSVDHIHLTSLKSDYREQCRLQYLHVMQHLSQVHASQLPRSVIDCLALLLSKQKEKEAAGQSLHSSKLNELRDDLITSLEAQLTCLRI